MRHLPGLLLPLSLLLGACSLSTPADPVLDCAAPFPELAETPEATEAPEAPSPEPQAPAVEPVRVPLAGLLSAELAGDGWRVFVDEGVTVLAHAGEGGNLDALVYAEAFSGWEKSRPSEEARRFLLTVDPALLHHEWVWGAPPLTIAAGLQTPPAVAPPPLQAVAGMAMTRTGGRGLGYTSEPGSFSGWKWIGANPQGVFLRLARSHGRWAGQEPPAPALKPHLDLLIGKFPQTEWMALGMDGGAPPERPAAPAALVLGSAGTPDGEVHLALLCARTPTCGQAPALAGLLTSLRPISSREIEAEGAEPLGELFYVKPELKIAAQADILPVAPAAAP